MGDRLVLENEIKKSIEETAIDDMSFSPLSPLFVCMCNTINIIVDDGKENTKPEESNEDNSLPGISFTLEE